MFVIKRDGREEKVRFDKITARLKILKERSPPLTSVDPAIVAQKVIAGVYNGVTTTQLDNLAAETAAYMDTQHPEYGALAARIAISNLHKETTKDWHSIVDKMRHHMHPITNEFAPLLSEECYNIIKENIETLQSALDFERDYGYDFFGFKTLERSYLVKVDGVIVERPQHMLMRVAVGIYKSNIKKVLKTYDLMSRRYYTHATPTLFNAATPLPQLSSCFLLTMSEDSIDGIYTTLKNCAMISKSAGGIGVSVHPIRASQSYIRGSNGTSNGIIPMLRVFNDTARYVDQGGGKRKGAFAIYLEPWHADIESWLLLKKNHGKEEQRCRDLFYGLWIPDLFMERVKQDGKWSLFCPDECRGLHDCWGDEFKALYEKYENAGKARKTMNAQDLWFQIIDSQIETGTPYMLYKDACNGKSNQKNLGTIRSSNLCCEIIEYTSSDEVAVCNLVRPHPHQLPCNILHLTHFSQASIALPMFVDDSENKVFNHDKLYEIVYHVTENLNRIIDHNYYPIPEARNSNMRHRPIGIGIQGLADTFCKLRMPFDSPEAKILNKEIFETMYFAAAWASSDLAMKENPYSSFEGSPASRGILSPDMWNVQPSSRWDFHALRDKIKMHGMRNSLLLAPMPTASTSQILGNNECFEPFTSNIYTRRVLAGEFTMVNKFLVNDLLKLGLWTAEMKNKIIANGGSIHGILEIPEDLRILYRTVWELKMKDLIDMAVDRGAFIDQSQSFNAFMDVPTRAKLTSMHFYAWSKGLKTGMYYLRTRPAADAIQITVDKEALVCKMQDDCVTCGS